MLIGSSIAGAFTVEAALAAPDRIGDLGIGQTGLLAPLVGLLTGWQRRRYVEVEAMSMKRRAEESG
ncbi:hypothetical protein AB0H03_08140 [Streptomyces sparsogenes]|uniref:hypothetical protein n=1 Tax=Streptomyces sparsogenes TaxID=67365 RepID=UPI0033EEEB29